MRSLITVLITILLMVFSGCATIKRTIKLESLSNDLVKVGIETENAVILFARNDVVNLFNEDLEKWFDPRIKQYVDDLSSLKSDTLIFRKIGVTSLQNAEFDLKFHTLLKKGKADIRLKGDEQSLLKIKYKYTRGKLGQEDAHFFTQDSVQLYHILLAFGE